MDFWMQAPGGLRVVRNGGHKGSISDDSLEVVRTIGESLPLSE